MKNSFREQIKNINTEGFPADVDVVEKPKKVDEPAETIKPVEKIKPVKTREKKSAANDSEVDGEEHRVVLKFDSQIFERLTALRIKNMNKGKLPSAQALITELLIKHLTKEGV